MFPFFIVLPSIIAVCFVCSIAVGLYAAENYTDGERLLSTDRKRLETGDSHAVGQRLMLAGILQAIAAILLTVAGLYAFTLM